MDLTTRRATSGNWQSSAAKQPCPTTPSKDAASVSTCEPWALAIKTSRKTVVNPEGVSILHLTFVFCLKRRAYPALPASTVEQFREGIRDRMYSKATRRIDRSSYSRNVSFDFSVAAILSLRRPAAHSVRWMTNLVRLSNAHPQRNRRFVFLGTTDPSAGRRGRILRGPLKVKRS
jgi:hypothetical protein